MIGIASSEYLQITGLLLTNFFDCDSGSCLSKVPCIEYGRSLDLTFTISDYFNVTIPTTDLLQAVFDNEYQCRFYAFNSGNRYILGNPFLKNYYSVFDIDSSVIGLG